jgi:hypothetical protein
VPIPNPGVSFYPLIFPSSPHQQEVWRARCAPSTARAVRARRCPIVRQLPAALPPLRYSLLSQFFPPPPTLFSPGGYGAGQQSLRPGVEIPCATVEPGEGGGGRGETERRRGKKEGKLAPPPGPPPPPIPAHLRPSSRPVPAQYPNAQPPPSLPPSLALNPCPIPGRHRPTRTEGLAPVGGRPPLLAASEPLFQYS